VARPLIRQPGLAQPLEVVHHGARRQTQRIRQLLDGVRPRREQADDPQP
jgi:hypothetical protein